MQHLTVDTILEDYMPGTRETAPTRRTTTLYDVLAALQTVIPPEEDDLVVALVVHWLRSGRITCAADATAAT